MKIVLPEKVKFIIETLEEHGYEAYAVGGCVRDTMLHRTPGDWDITTQAKPEQVKEIFAEKKIHTIDTGKLNVKKCHVILPHIPACNQLFCCIIYMNIG